MGSIPSHGCQIEVKAIKQEWVNLVYKYIIYNSQYTIK